MCTHPDVRRIAVPKIIIVQYKEMFKIFSILAVDYNMLVVPI